MRFKCIVPSASMCEKPANHFLLLYASQTGQAQAIAEELFEKAEQCGLAPEMHCLSMTEKKVSSGVCYQKLVTYNRQQDKQCGTRLETRLNTKDIMFYECHAQMHCLNMTKKKRAGMEKAMCHHSPIIFRNGLFEIS